jgi:flavin reductase (DIM6/NTAB) family NADH-FMN oxidoreductase RutF
MPVVSYASVSTSPPLVAVACNPDSFTCKLALKAGAFSLSLLDRSHTSAIDGLATTHGTTVKDKLTSVGLRHSKGSKLSVPVLEEARASLECTVYSKAKTGDHTLVIGQVEAAYANSAFSDFWNFRRYKPLLYTGWKDGLTTYDAP